MNEKYIPTAGSLIASILETLGYHYQSVFLNNLSDPLTNEVGGLIYLFGIALVVLMTAVQGKYKLGTWLLIGPPLFFAAIIPRAEIEAVNWRFGNEQRNQAAVEEGVEEAVSENKGSFVQTPRVSKLFRAYVSIVSTVSSEIVGVISKNRKDTDLTFLVQAELFSRLHTVRINNPAQTRLFQKAMSIDCGAVINAARAIYDPSIRTRVNDYLAAKGQTVDGVEHAKTAEAKASYYRAIFNELVDRKSIKLDGLSAGVPARGATNSEEFKKLRNAIKDGVLYSCRDIWELVVASIYETADKEFARILKDAEKSGIKPSTIEKVALQISAHDSSDNDVTQNPEDSERNVSEEGALVIRRIISQYILRNEMKNPDDGAWMSMWIGSIETPEIKMQSTGRETFTEFSRIAAREYSERTKLVTAATSIPYYQGIALYILGATFPFFALVLLVPGKHGGFMLWFSLWLWVKSWDIGFAIVMLMSDVFFAILGTERQSEGAIYGVSGDFEEIGLAMSVVQEMDPTFQLGTYYAVIGSAMIAVPTITAQIILGSLRGGASLISAGVQRNATEAMAHQLGVSNQEAVNKIYSAKQASRDRAVQKAISNFNKGIGASGAGGLRTGITSSNGGPKRGTGAGGVSTSRGSASRGAATYKRNSVGNFRTARPGTPVNSQLSQDVQNASEGGLGQGLRTGGNYNKNNDLNNPAKLLTARSAQIQAGDVKLRSAERKQALSAAVTKAIWEDEATPQQAYLTRQLGMMGALPLPPSNFLDEYAGGKALGEKQIKSYQRQQNRIAKESEMHADIVQAIRGVVNKIPSKKNSSSKYTNKSTFRSTVKTLASGSHFSLNITKKFLYGYFAKELVDGLDGKELQAILDNKVVNSIKMPKILRDSLNTGFLDYKYRDDYRKERDRLVRLAKELLDKKESYSTVESYFLNEEGDEAFQRLSNLNVNLQLQIRENFTSNISANLDKNATRQALSDSGLSMRDDGGLTNFYEELTVVPESLLQQQAFSEGDSHKSAREQYFSTQKNAGKDKGHSEGT